MEMESGNGGREGRQQLLPFRRKPESLRRSRIRRRRPLQCSASRKILAVARMRFRLSPEWKILFFAARFSSFPFPPLFHSRTPFPFPRRRESLPASAGNSAKRNGRLSANAAVAAEIPAFAGMERRAGMEGGGGNGKRERNGKWERNGSESGRE